MTSVSPKKSVVARWGSFLALFIVLFWLIYYTSLNTITQAEESIVEDPEITTVSDVFQQLTLEKPGKFASTQDIVVTAQANGKVATIYYKEGQQVNWGQPVIALSDTIASYKLQTDRAKNSLNRAILTKQQTELTLNQQIESAKNAYENAQQAYEYAKKASDIAVKQAGLQVTTADSSIDTLKNSFWTTKTSVLNFMNNVIDTADKLLGISQYYEDNLDKWVEVYIWAKDSSKKEKAKQELRELYTLRDKIKALADVPSTNDELKTSTDSLANAIQTTSNFAGTMVEVMRNSISSVGTLSQAEIDGYISTFQLYQNWLLGQSSLKAVITEFKGKVDAQLSDDWTITQESANLWLENALASTENSLFQTEIALKNAKLNYDTLVENKWVQLDLLSNAIVDAKIAYETALTQYNKLSVRSPVSWVIGEILVSEWQEVWAGTQMFKVSGTKKQQIEVYITADEYQYLQDDKPVEVVYQDQSLTGTIDAISTVADKTNLFKATIQLDTDVSLLWDVAKVKFPIKLQKNTLLPLDQVKILNDNEWEIKIWNGENTEKQTVQIKKVWWSFVELKEALSWDLKLVLN